MPETINREQSAFLHGDFRLTTKSVAAIFGVAEPEIVAPQKRNRWGAMASGLAIVMDTCPY